MNRSSDPSVPATPRRPVLLLAAGAAMGLAAAALGLLRDGSPSVALPSRAVATVNDQLILSEDFDRLVAGLASERRDPIDEEDRRHVLDRLIDEELLVQRALALGLAQNDRRVRADLTQAMVVSVIAEAENEPVSRVDLARFYDEHQEFFTRPGRRRLRQIFVRGATDEEAGTRAQEAARRLRSGEAFEVVAEQLGDPLVAPVPDAPLPAKKLREYLGPTLMRAAWVLEAGEVGDPVRSGMGFHVLQVLEREPDRVPPLAEIEGEVLSERRRRRGDEALRSYLDRLREDADVRVVSGLR